MIQITSEHGAIVLGPIRISWANAADGYDGFTAVAYGDHSLELGAVDQDQQGIYLTAYKDDEVASTRPLFLLP